MVRVEVFSAKSLEQVKIYILWRPYLYETSDGCCRPPTNSRTWVEVAAEYCTWEKAAFRMFCLNG